MGQCKLCTGSGATCDESGVFSIAMAVRASGSVVCGVSLWYVGGIEIPCQDEGLIILVGAMKYLFDVGVHLNAYVMVLTRSVYAYNVCLSIVWRSEANVCHATQWNVRVGSIIPKFVCNRLVDEHGDPSSRFRARGCAMEGVKVL